MRKIAADIQNAIRTNTRFKGANTEILRVENIGAESSGVVRFHGHTTRDRINAVRGALGLPLVSLTQFHDGASLLTWFN